MKEYKRKGYLVKTDEFFPKCKEKFFLQLITKYKGDAFYRKGNFANEIIWDGKSYMFPTDKKANYRKFNKGGFLYRLVRKDARAYVAEGKKPPKVKSYPVNEYNEKFKKLNQRITGTDVNHAYWRIAFNLGIISENTYKKGLDDDFKVVRLSALSTLGSGKDYQVINGGKITDSYVMIGEDKLFHDLYTAIRYTCYKYMQKLKAMLGEDFVAYKTDCIYYVDTPENRKLVKDFFKKNRLETGQLVEKRKNLHGQASS